MSVAVLDSDGRLIMESILETKAVTILQFVHELRGSLHVTFEEGTCAAWLHDLKNIFKGVATRAAMTAGPLQDFYARMVAHGTKPAMARRLTLARKIAAITLLVWKKGV